MWQCHQTICLSIVVWPRETMDDHDVCKAFGQYIKFQVARQESEPVCNMLKTRVLLCGVKNMICDM